MAKNIEHSLLGQDLMILPERALFWKQQQMLIVADPHFGKAQHFREVGIPVPGGTTANDLDRLTLLIRRLDPVSLLFLGDLTHDKMDAPIKFFGLIDKWRNRHMRLKLLLARGNHDHRSTKPPEDFRFDLISENFRIAPFRFSHKPELGASGYTISGHYHPAVRMKGRGRQKETLPCFYFGARYAILPAFGSFTGNQILSPTIDDRIFVIAEDEVVEVGSSL